MMPIINLTDKLYKENLKLAREEDPNISDAKGHSLASEWTIEDISSRIARYLDQRYWKKQDSINKAFFE